MPSIRSRRRFPVPAIETLEGRTLMSVAVDQGFWSEFGGDPSHTALSAAASQDLRQIHWKTKIDLQPQFSSGELLAHYGSPVITAHNTVIVPVKTSVKGSFVIEGIDGATGQVKWKFASDYVEPSNFAMLSFSCAMTPAGRLYVPGNGGTVYALDHLDGNTHPHVRQLAFYGSSNYFHNRSSFNSSVFINTPLTVSKSGVLYFGYQVNGANPLNLSGGIARINVPGHGTYVSASRASGDITSNKVGQDSAPALSPNGKYLYVAVNHTRTIGAAEIRSASYLLCLDAASLQTIGKARLTDPLSGSDATVPDGSTASPMVGPDGDVDFGILDNPQGSNNTRGWLLHFNADLSIQHIPGAFGWDDTASVVPASMVKSYHGSSTYLILTKYNNYANGGGDGVNKMAVLDPHATQINPVNGQPVMKEVETIAGVTPDVKDHPGYPHAVKEWCVNTVVIDPATDSALVNSEDGVLYRWNLSTNTFTQKIRLTPGLSEAYTPTLMGPDGTVYAIQDGTLFAVGNKKVGG